MKCATITKSYSNDNYLELMKCPKTSGFKWKIEDSSGVCAQNDDSWVDWEYPDKNDQRSLGYYLDIYNHAGWISPAMTGGTNCGIESKSSWKDTTSVKAFSSVGTVNVFYKS